MTATRWVVWCETHAEFLVFAGVSGTTWSADREEARRFDTKPAALRAVELATWLDHRPVPWAVADEPAFVAISWEARCSRCGEVFVPNDEDDLVHVVRDDGVECGGDADPESVGQWGVVRPDGR